MVKRDDFQISLNYEEAKAVVQSLDYLNSQLRVLVFFFETKGDKFLRRLNYYITLRNKIVSALNELNTVDTEA